MEQNILIIEDDSEIRAIQRDYLQKEGFTIFEAEDGEEGLSKFKKEKINLVVLDLNIPQIDGIEVCKKIRESSGVPIIMVTARTKEIDELLGLEIGADDYLKKPFSPRILVSRVKSLLKRPNIENLEIIKSGELQLDIQKRTLTLDSKSIDITTIQFNILQQLMQNPGKVFERYDLMNRSYNEIEIPDIFDRTMDSHIKNIRKLIEKDTKKPQYILTVRGIGYKFNENL